MEYRYRMQQFTEGLEQARRKLFRARLIVALKHGLERGAYGAVGGGAIFVLVAATAALSGLEWQGSVWLWGGVLAFAGFLLAMIFTMLPAWSSRPTLAETAERLDLCSGEHNTVATALNFVQREMSDIFAQAAIISGLNDLRQLASQAVAEDAYSVSRRGLLSCAAAVLLLLVAGWSCSRFAPDRQTSLGTTSELAAHADLKRGPWEDLRPEHQPNREVPMAANTLAVAATRQSGGKSEPTPITQKEQSVPAKAGQMAAGSMMQTGQSGHSISQSAQSRGGAAKSQQSDKPKAPAKQSAKEASEKKPFPPNGQEPDEANSSIHAGRSGRGGMPATQNSWSQRSFAADKETEEDQDDEEVEDQAEANTQRGGVQPHLKDRNQAPSRDLGISSDQGKPGTGRGGPTPPKKSRGTASLVLGIPVPDFVKGKLGPGTNKVTYERSDPLTMPGQSLTPVDVAARQRAEDFCPRFETVGAETALIKRSLIRLHQESMLSPAGNEP